MERDYEAEAFKIVVEHSRHGGPFNDRHRFAMALPVRADLDPDKLIEAASKRLAAIPHALNHAVAIASQLEADRHAMTVHLEAYCSALDRVRRLANPPLETSAINEAYVAACTLKSHLGDLSSVGSLPTFEQMRGK